jgi:hypothetical protein
MNEPTVITIPCSTMDNMRMELEWRFFDLFDQIWLIREILEEAKRELAGEGDFDV